MEIAKTTALEFNHVYSYPGNMECVVKEFYTMFDKIAVFLLPLKINTTEGLGWVIIELLNNAVRSPVSLAMNMCINDINQINFYTDIIVKKTVTPAGGDGGTRYEISVMNRGEYSEDVVDSIHEVLNGGLSILDCEERFMLKGSYTGNGGMGIFLSKKNVENALGGTFTLDWHDGFYDFTISFVEKD